MSELVARLAVQQLRNKMFPALPQDIQSIFPQISDTLVQGGANQVPNIVVGEYVDYGANAASPMIAVSCEGPQEGIVNVWRHLNLTVDMWISGEMGGNVDGRRVISIIYEYVNRALQNINWSGNGGIVGSGFVRIKRSYESERSKILFDPTNKAFRIANIYKVEAICDTGWY